MSWEAWGDPPDPICAMCYREPGSCVCPECPECGEVGNPDCYKEHGLDETDEQGRSRYLHSPDNYCPDDVI